MLWCLYWLQNLFSTTFSLSMQYWSSNFEPVFVRWGISLIFINHLNRTGNCYLRSSEISSEISAFLFNLLKNSEFWDIFCVNAETSFSCIILAVRLFNNGKLRNALGNKTNILRSLLVLICEKGFKFSLWTLDKDHQGSTSVKLSL